MNKLTKLNPETCPLTIAHICSLPAPKGFSVFKGQAYEVENTGKVASVFQIGYGEQFENQWTDSDFGMPIKATTPEVKAVNSEASNTIGNAILNAIRYTDGQSFSDGNIVVGIGEGQVAIAFNNTLFNQNQLTVMQDQDAKNIYALLTSALKAKGLLV